MHKYPDRHLDKHPDKPPVARFLVWFAALLACALALAALGSPTEAATAPSADDPVSSRAPFATRVIAGDRILGLNGHGQFETQGLPAYLVALYTARPVGDAAVLLAPDEPARLDLMALRDVTADDLGKMLVKGMVARLPPGEIRHHLDMMLALGRVFGQWHGLRAGQTLSFDHRPGQGTHVLIDERPTGGPVQDDRLFPLLMQQWIGDQPRDGDLRARLLSRRAPA